MSRFIYFLQRKGIWICLAHLGIGTFAMFLFTIIGLALKDFQIAGIYVSTLFFWQSNLLCRLSCPVAYYENGSPVLAGLPFLIISVIGILSGIPIYTLLSMIVHYIWSGKNDE